MVFTVYVELEPDDALMYTLDRAAEQVLAALGGNPTVDYCTVAVGHTTGYGKAGTPAPEEIPA
jgi:hypothetical protein